MKKLFAVVSLFSLSLAWMLPVDGAAPVKLSTVAPIGDLTAEVQAMITRLEGFVADKESYAAAKDDKRIQQAAGVLACLAQAIAEHEKKADANFSGPGLRDAAIAVRDSKSLDDAKKTLDAAKKVVAGESTGEAKVEYPWNKLINLHRMMEEVNARNSKLRRVIRRPKDPQAESLHASTLAVLAMAIHADTHEVKEKKDIGKWQKLALGFQKSMTSLSAAMKKKDASRRSLYLAGVKSCSACHEAFRKE